MGVVAINVYVNGVKEIIDTGVGVNVADDENGNSFPQAVLDSGVPSILATPTLANGIWGALGIGPAADGNCESSALIYVSFCSPI